MASYAGCPKASAVAEADPAKGNGIQLVVLMQQLMRGQQEFRDEINGWQDQPEVNLNVVQVKKGLEVVQQVQREGWVKIGKARLIGQAFSCSRYFSQKGGSVI